MKPLKQAVREHLEERSLSAAQLDTLMTMQQRRQPARSHHLAPIVSALAVAAALLAAVALWLDRPAASMPYRIAAEVVDNHIRLKPLEVEARDIDGLRRYFDQLDFVPVQSSLVADAGMQVLGGRYCSIQGVTAAQIRMHQPGSRDLQTVYQTAYDPQLFSGLPRLEEGQAPIDVYVKGVQVRVWVEKGVLFAMTLPDGDAG